MNSPLLSIDTDIAAMGSMPEKLALARSKVESQDIVPGATPKELWQQLAEQGNRCLSVDRRDFFSNHEEIAEAFIARTGEILMHLLASSRHNAQRMLVEPNLVDSASHATLSLAYLGQYRFLCMKAAGADISDDEPVLKLPDPRIPEEWQERVGQAMMFMAMNQMNTHDASFQSRGSGAVAAVGRPAVAIQDDGLMIPQDRELQRYIAALQQHEDSRPRVIARPLTYSNSRVISESSFMVPFEEFGDQELMIAYANALFDGTRRELVQAMKRPVDPDRDVSRFAQNTLLYVLSSQHADILELLTGEIPHDGSSAPDTSRPLVRGKREKDRSGTRRKPQTADQKKKRRKDAKKNRKKSRR